MEVLNQQDQDKVAAQLCEGVNELNISGQVDGELPQTSATGDSSDCDVKPGRWLRVRDSLEGISRVSPTRTTLRPTPININDLSNQGDELSKTNSQKTDKFIKSKSPVSDSLLVSKKPTSQISFSKIFLWDPWNKIGRKSKKEKLRKKKEEKLLKLEHRNRSEGPSPILRKPVPDKEKFLTHLEQDLSSGEQQSVGADRNSKCVRFQKDVNVVYFAGDQIVEQITEPLKKETEQQERNKELRREVCAEALSDIKFVLRKSHSEYTHNWNKK